ncbi:DUF3515 family protein [Streptomyces sp. KR80]|uniref:DUF3515 family protein n=1 Tax=Streptomyces sp. KR80 TaxID=3457426 RepID=UPI003FD59715
MKRPTRRQKAAIALTAGALALAAVLAVREVNSPAFGLQAAPHAASPACQELARGYVDQIDGRDRENLNVTGATMWGGGQIIWRCGLIPIQPTPDPCVNVNGVDWVLQLAKSRGDRRTLITYGRTPAVEVTVSKDITAIDGVFVDIAKMARPLPKYTKCLDQYGR